MMLLLFAKPTVVSMAQTMRDRPAMRAAWNHEITRQKPIEATPASLEFWMNELQTRDDWTEVSHKIFDSPAVVAAAMDRIREQLEAIGRGDLEALDDLHVKFLGLRRLYLKGVRFEMFNEGEVKHAWLMVDSLGDGNCFYHSIFGHNPELLLQLGYTVEQVMQFILNHDATEAMADDADNLGIRARLVAFLRREDVYRRIDAYFPDPDFSLRNLLIHFGRGRVRLRHDEAFLANAGDRILHYFDGVLPVDQFLRPLTRQLDERYIRELRVFLERDDTVEKIRVQREDRIDVEAILLSIWGDFLIERFWKAIGTNRDFGEAQEAMLLAPAFRRNFGVLKNGENWSEPEEIEVENINANTIRVDGRNINIRTGGMDVVVGGKKYRRIAANQVRVARFLGTKRNLMLYAFEHDDNQDNLVLIYSVENHFQRAYLWNPDYRPELGGG